MSTHLLVSGASGGIGAAIARHGVAAGWHVTSFDRTAGDDPDVDHVTVDVTDDAAVGHAIEGLAPVDVVVNNAGIVRFGPLLAMDVDDWRAVVDVNLTGTFVLARAAARTMVERGGSIINITSMNGVAPGPGSGAYGATKAGVALLTQQMALEWAPKVRVNAVAPGLVDAGMAEAIYADPESRRAREEKVPLGRLAEADDIARVVLWLAGPDSAYVTGQTILVDGGVTMSMIPNLPRPAAIDQGQ